MPLRGAGAGDDRANQVRHGRADALGVYLALGGGAAEGETDAHMVRNAQVLSASARRTAGGVAVDLDRDLRRRPEPEPVHGEKLRGARGQRFAERRAGVVGPEIDHRLDRDPAVDAGLRGAVVQPHELTLAPVRVRERVGVRGEHVVAVLDGGAHQVYRARSVASYGRGLHGGDGAAEKHGGGVEEVHPVLDEDATAAFLVPEPVVVPQVLVAGVVLEQEAVWRPQDLPLQPPYAGDHAFTGGGSGHQGREVGGCRGGRLLGEDVPAGRERSARDLGVRGRRRGDHHNVHVGIAHELLPGVADPAVVPLRQDGGGLPLAVGDSADLDVGEVRDGVGEEGREPTGADNSEPERNCSRHVSPSLRCSARIR
jgi:hypothetical protein